MFEAEAKKYAMDDARRAVSVLRRKFAYGVAQLTLNAGSKRFLETITTAPHVTGYLPMSNFAVRLAATEAMVDTLLEQHAANKDNEGFQHWLAVFAWDDGFQQLDNPAVDLKRMRSKVDKAMRQFGLHGIYLTEVDILLPLIENDPIRWMFHIHMVCWKPAGKLKPTKLAKAIIATKRFPNNLNAKSVKFTRRKRNRRRVAGLAYYLTKVPAAVKILKEDRYKPGKTLMVKDAGRFTPALAVRMIEVLSKMNIYENVGGVGEGVALRKAWKARMSAWEKTGDPSLSTPIAGVLEVNRSWANVHSQSNPTAAASL